MKAKEKIALVTIRYGEDINGGAEYHCRMLAERLADDYNVEVLTTCVRNYNTGINELPEGEEILNGVLVHRFKVAPVDGEHHEQYSKKEKPVRKLRRFLFRIGLLRYISTLHPVWTCKREVEVKAFKSYRFYSPDMCNFVKNNKERYRAFIPVNMAESTTYFTALEVPQKTILIPTMHNQSIFFKSAQTEVMTKVAYIGFNAEAEQRLAESVFGQKMSAHGIISVGVEIVDPASWQATREKYKLPEDYLLYIGRVTSGKIGSILEYFADYKKRYEQSSLKLVLVGGIDANQKKSQQSDVLYTGFVSDEEKMVILQHAKIIVNPSKFESLSLMLLEAMGQGKPVLVNGCCAVLKEHCIKSDHAALYYTRKKSFISKLHLLECSSELREQMGRKAQKYVKECYDWSIILSRLKDQIEAIGLNS